MKYIIGASIGGLFGLSMPLLMAVNGSNVAADSNDVVNNPNDEASRQEESQHADPLRAIIDHKTGDVGLLIERYDIIENLPMSSRTVEYEDSGHIWAWEIFWSGPGTDKNNRYFPYTEVGLLNMIRCGTFEYIACSEK